MVFPRMLARASTFAFFTVPEKLDDIIYGNGASMIAEATGGNGSKSAFSSLLSGKSEEIARIVQQSAPAAAVGTMATDKVSHGLFSTFTFHQLRNFGGILSYVTSKWALACFALVSALINVN